MGLDREINHYSPAQVGRLIRHMRTVAGITQEVVAAGLQMDRASITKMEGGKHTVSLANLMKIADLCGFTLSVRAAPRVK